MRRKGLMRVLLALVGLASFTAIQAMEGTFDRRDEVQKYVGTMKSGTRGAVIDASREIFNSGLGDATLAAAINERLLTDFRSPDTIDGNGAKYIEWLVKALASTGVQEFESTIAKVGKEGRAYQIAKYCDDERSKLAWYRGRNEVMASRKYHSEGDDPSVSRIINLVMADDFSYKQFASDRINWGRLLDPRIMEAVNQQVLQHIDSTNRGVSRDQAKAMGMFIKVLGYSGNIKYRETMQRVKSAKTTSLMKKYADESLRRLQT